MALCVRMVWRSLEKEFGTRLSTRKPDRSSTIIFNREKDTTVPGNFLREVRRKLLQVSPNFFALFRSCRRLPLPDRARGRRTRSFPARFVNFSHQAFAVLIIGFYFRRPLTNRVAEKIWSLKPVALLFIRVPGFLRLANSSNNSTLIPPCFEQRSTRRLLSLYTSSLDSRSFLCVREVDRPTTRKSTTTTLTGVFFENRAIL